MKESNLERDLYELKLRNVFIIFVRLHIETVRKENFHRIKYYTNLFREEMIRIYRFLEHVN